MHDFGKECLGLESSFDRINLVIAENHYNIAVAKPLVFHKIFEKKKQYS